MDTSHLSLRHRGAHFHSLAEHRRLSCADVAQAAEARPKRRMLPCLETYCTALVQGQVAATTHQSSDAAAVRICRGEVATDFTSTATPQHRIAFDDRGKAHVRQRVDDLIVGGWAASQGKAEQ